MKNLFNNFSNKVTKAVASPYAFIIALLTVLIWGASGPFFHYSDTWEIIISVGTTIVTFLMMFLIQQSQNKDTKAIQVKLDELIRSSNARNEVAEIEKKTIEEIN